MSKDETFQRTSLQAKPFSHAQAKHQSEQEQSDRVPMTAFEQRLSRLMQDQALAKIERVQSLWSGYGEIARYALVDCQQPVIVKHIAPTNITEHPKGWSGELSHQRKLTSYKIEATFYQSYASLCDEYCKVPLLLAHSSCQQDEEQILVLEDLDALGFFIRKRELDITSIKLCLRWLGYFHARFLQHSASELWPVGSYWHLATRPDEYQALPDSDLKQGAFMIDEALNSAKFQCVIHGDAKVANFCFNNDSSDVAAVDFQYVGKSAGIKDVMYLLGSCLDSKALTEHNDALLCCYFDYLNQAVLHYNINIDVCALEQEWRHLYSFAWADFNRFLSGWSPHHSKRNDFMLAQTQSVVDYLRAKRTN